MYKPQDYKDIADEMVANDVKRDQKFEKIDKLHNVEWEMPREWQNTEWIRKYPSTKPADALDAAIRSLSTKEPRLTVLPIMPNQETKASFDRIERGLMWAWRQMGRRMQFNPTRAIVTSAIKYDEITAQLVHIPSHNKAIKQINDSKGYKAIYGDFSLIVHNPRNVHAQYSDNGFERVVLCKIQPLHKVVDFWGKKGQELKKLVDGTKNTAMTQLMRVYDYMDGDVRYVWTKGLNGGGIDFDLMEPTPHELDFIPWICRTGGSNLEDLVENQRRPLLNTVVNANLWDTTNLFRSLMLSLTMARAAEPTLKTTSIGGEGVEIDATEGIGQIKLRQGEDAQRIPAGEIGQTIQSMYSLLGGEMETSAGINLLEMNSMPAGVAFATYNAKMQSAMASINPHKQIAEQAISDIFCLMTEWIRYSGKGMIFYDDREKNKDDGISTLGKQETVTSDMLPEASDFNATVKLTEYVPSDELGKINAMTMMVNNLKYPIQRAMEALDVTDPKTALEEWGFEQKDQAAIMEEVKDMQFNNDMMRQRRQAKMQQKMQEEQAAAQGQQAQASQDQSMMQGMQGQDPSAPNMMQNIMQGMSPELGGAIPPGQAGTQQEAFPNTASNNLYEQTQGVGFAGNLGGTTPVSAGRDMKGVGFPSLEGMDMRGLKQAPNARKAEK